MSTYRHPALEREVRVREPMRLDQVLGMPPRMLAPLCASGRVRVVGPGERFGRALTRGRPRIEPGARVLVLDEECDPRLLAEDIPLEILFADEALLVVGKPAGLPTYPGPGHVAGTLANALRALGLPLSTVEGPLRPGIVHRLDVGTSGAVLVARTDAAHRVLAEQLLAHAVRRTYLALVLGSPEWDARTVESHLGQRRRGRKAQGSVSPRIGRRALTRFEVLARGSAASMVRAQPETGRRHQIRVHLAETGHPVVGDILYGSTPARRVARELGLARPALHALRVELRHPASGAELSVTAPLPDDMLRAGLPHAVQP